MPASDSSYRGSSAQHQQPKLQTLSCLLQYFFIFIQVFILNCLACHAMLPLSLFIMWPTLVDCSQTSLAYNLCLSCAPCASLSRSLSYTGCWLSIFRFGFLHEQHGVCAQPQGPHRIFNEDLYPSANKSIPTRGQPVSSESRQLCLELLVLPKMW